MALAALGNFFQNNSKTAAASFVAALGANVNTDELLVVVVASDNRATTDTDDSLHTSLKIQTTGAVDVLSFTKVAEWTNGQGAADAGATVSMWWAICNGDYTTAGHQLRLDLAASKTARAMAGHRFSRDTAKTVEVVGTPLTNAVDGATSAGSLATSGLASEEHLHVRGLAYEGPSATFTLSTNFTSLTSSSLAHTTGGGAATNMGARGEYRINTSTGETSNPSWSSAADQASILAVFRELAAGAALDPGTIADALAVTDAVALSRGLAVDDALAMTDARTFDRGLVQADALAITDSLSSAGAFVRSVDDALAITDGVVAGLMFPVAVNDALAVTDAVRMDVALALADAAGITDAAALAQSRAFADALGVTDSAAPVILKAVAVDDALAITDNVTSVAALARSVADALAVTDNIASNAALARTVADSIAVTDAVAFVRELALADALGLTDSQAFAVALALADALGLVDTATPAGGYLRTVVDTVGITDAITPLWTPGTAPTYIDIGAILELELDSITRTLELAERTATLDVDATERGIELDDTTRGFDLDG